MRVLPVATTILALLAGCTANEGPSTDETPTIRPAMTDPESPSTPATGASDTGSSHGDISLEKVEKTEAEWREQLTPEQYHVTREEGTERAFTGKYWDTKTVGTYRCIGCGLPLFDSTTKFDSGTGWPSFYKPVDERFVAQDRDMKLGYARTEVTCARCGAHLGHVFDDGPAPTGLRFCVNSAALDLDPSKGGDEAKK